MHLRKTVKQGLVKVQSYFFIHQKQLALKYKKFVNKVTIVTRFEFMKIIIDFIKEPVRPRNPSPLQRLLGVLFFKRGREFRSQDLIPREQTLFLNEGRGVYPHFPQFFPELVRRRVFKTALFLFLVFLKPILPKHFFLILCDGSVKSDGCIGNLILADEGRLSIG